MSTIAGNPPLPGANGLRRGQTDLLHRLALKQEQETVHESEELDTLNGSRNHYVLRETN